jgi:hypothetical protein
MAAHTPLGSSWAWWPARYEPWVLPAWSATNVRRDPRCTLFVFGPPPLWLGIDAIANILDGPDAAEHCIELLLARHGRDDAGGLLAHDDQLETDRRYEFDEYREHARARKLFVFEFDVTRTYGNYGPSRL